MDIPDKNVGCVSFQNEVLNVVKFSSDSNYCMVGGANKVIELINFNKQLKLKTYSGHAGEITDVLSSCDNGKIFSASADRSVNEYDVLTGVCVGRYRKHFNVVTSIVTNDESSVLVSGSVDNKVCMWDVRDKKLIQTLDEAKDTITKVCLNKHIIASASLDNCVRCYDVRCGRVIEDCVGFGVNDCVVVFDSKGVCCLYNDENCANVKIIDLDSGCLLKKIPNVAKISSKKMLVVENDKLVCVCDQDEIIFHDISCGNLIKKVAFPKQQTICMDYSKTSDKKTMLVAGGNLLQVFQNL